MNPVCYVYHDFYRAEDWVSGCKDQCLRSCSPRGVALLYIGSQWGEKGSEVAFQFQKKNKTHKCFLNMNMYSFNIVLNVFYDTAIIK